MFEINTINYYQLLGLKPELEIDQIRQELLDKFTQTKARAGLATGEKLEQINKYLEWIKEATKILTDPDAKANYDDQLLNLSLTEIKEKTNLKNTAYTIEEIWHLIDQGDYLYAVEKAKILVYENSNDDSVWEVYGRASYLSDDTQTAIYAGEKSIECNPQRASLYADLAEYYADIQQWDKAIAKLNQTIELEPNNLGCKLALSQIYIQSEKWGDAEAILTGVLSQDRSNETARQFMAIVIGSKAQARFPEIDELLKQNKKREARKILKEVHQQFEEAQKLAQNDPEIKDLLNSESILVRRELGVNFYLRVLGLLIDFAIVSPAILLITIHNGNNPIAVTLGILLMIAVWGYSWVWLAYKNNGQDLTKRLLGMQIVSDSNTSPTLNQFIGRAIAKPFSIGLGGLFPFLSIIFSFFLLMGEFGSGEAAGFVGAMIGFLIGIFVALFKLSFDLFFVTSKEYLPNFFGWLLFLHEHISKTSVIHSTKDDFINFGEYNMDLSRLEKSFWVKSCSINFNYCCWHCLNYYPYFYFCRI
jgi:tetratricopeptide (TPR) repeat protein